MALAVLVVATPFADLWLKFGSGGWPVERLILAGLFVVVLLNARESEAPMPTQVKMVIGWLLLVGVGGLLTLLYTGVGFRMCISACLVPPMVLYMAFTCCKGERDVLFCIDSAIAAGAAACVMVYAANMLGLAAPMYSADQTLWAYEIQSGAMKLSASGNWVGSFGAFYATILIWRGLHSRSMWKSAVNFGCVMLMAVVVLKSNSKLGVIGFVMGLVLCAIGSAVEHKTLASRKMLLGTAFAVLGVVAALLFLDKYYDFLNLASIEGRFTELAQGRESNSSIEYRLDLVSWVRNTAGIVGIGFGNAYTKEDLDESMFVIRLVNGAGIIGGVGHLGAVISIAWIFLARLARKGPELNWAFLGLALFIIGLLVSLASDQFLGEAITCQPFWMMLGALLKGVYVSGQGGGRGVAKMAAEPRARPGVSAG